MLKISRLADYSTVIMSYLATRHEQYQSAAMVALHTGIALPTVSKILKMLNDAALLISTRGSNGGYQLVRAAHEISVADIIIAIDGSPAVTQCCDEENDCEHDRDCGLRANWQMINQIITDVLYSLSLADMQKPLPRETPIQFHGLSEKQRAKLNQGQVHDR